MHFLRFLLSFLFFFVVVLVIIQQILNVKWPCWLLFLLFLLFWFFHLLFFLWLLDIHVIKIEDFVFILLFLFCTFFNLNIVWLVLFRNQYLFLWGYFVWVRFYLLVLLSFDWVVFSILNWLVQVLIGLSFNNIFRWFLIEIDQILLALMLELLRVEFLLISFLENFVLIRFFHFFILIANIFFRLFLLLFILF